MKNRYAVALTRWAAISLLVTHAVSGHAQSSALALPGADVDGLLRYAQEHNPDFQAMRLEAEAAQQRIQAAGALADPLVRMELENVTNAGMDNRPQLLPANVGSTKYTLMQPVPFWGKRDLRRELAMADADQAKGKATVLWNEVAAKIKATYAQYYQVAGNERLAREILDLLSRVEQLAQSRYASGLALQQDAIRAQVEQTSLQSELIGLESEKHHLQVRLNALLSRPAMAALAEPERLQALPAAAALDFAALAERARMNNPQVFAEEARIRSADKGRELAYRNRYPDLLLGVIPTQVGGRVTTWGLMVEMNVPLQQASRRSQEREAEAMLSVAQARKEAAANQVQADLAETLSALDTSRRMESLISNRLLPQAELSFQSALSAYENGRIDFATLLDAQRQIRKAKQDRLRLQAEAQARLADLEKLVGGKL